jgi:3-phenylpropionate/trans-cinnamate dioxygenase ferredoxin reductase subunit
MNISTSTCSLKLKSQSFHYDKLIIATGSRPRKIALPGSDLPGVHYLRNIDDVNAIRASLTTNSRIAIIGAGYIGLEVAAVAAQLGHAVTVVEMADRVMSRVVSKEVSHFYQEIHSAHGVALELSANIDRLTGTNRVDGVALTSGQRLPADIVIVGIGIVPNNDQCRTSDENIYAVGDCTWHPNAVLGFDLRLESVHNALEQAKTAATNICGEELAYAQVPWFWSDQFDLKLQIAGLSAGYDRTVIRGDIGASKFSCLYLSEGRLIAIDAIVIDPMLLRDVQTELRDMAN